VTVSRLTGWRVMTPMDRDDERLLVARLRARDTGEFDDVYDVYRPRVFAFLLRMTRNRTLAEDLLDETWLRLVSHAPRLLPDTRIGPWLFTVARNLYWSSRRDSLVEETFAPELLTLCGISSEALRQRLSRARAVLAQRLRETPAIAALKKGYAT
jgi:DNA-directed RNA polymerase specialized sigma24 family protein